MDSLSELLEKLHRENDALRLKVSIEQDLNEILTRQRDAAIEETKLLNSVISSLYQERARDEAANIARFAQLQTDLRHSEIKVANKLQELAGTQEQLDRLNKVILEGLDCLEQNVEDPDTVAIKILRLGIGRVSDQNE